MALAHVKTDAIVADHKTPACALEHFQIDLGGPRMLAHIGQGFLQHMQHLHLHIGWQRQAIAVNGQVGRQAGLVLELLQRFLQGLPNVLGVGAGAEMHQQLAHVADTFAQPGVQFVQRLRHLHRLAFLGGCAQQLHLYFQEHQRLRNRVMQLAGQHGTLLGNGRFPGQRGGAQAFQRAGQVTCQRIEQFGFFRTQRHGAAEKQIEFTQQAVLQPDGHADDTFVTDLGAAPHRNLVMAQDRDDTGG